LSTARPNGNIENNMPRTIGFKVGDDSTAAREASGRSPERYMPWATGVAQFAHRPRGTPVARPWRTPFTVPASSDSERRRGKHATTDITHAAKRMPNVMPRQFVTPHSMAVCATRSKKLSSTPVGKRTSKPRFPKRVRPPIAAFCCSPGTLDSDQK
jgi:hypothetical protein